MHIKQERRCVCCREAHNQAEMLRVAKVNNEYLLDVKQKLQGRGAYICKTDKCLETTIKKKLLNRAFKSNLDNSIYIQLGEYEKNN